MMTQITQITEIEYFKLNRAKWTLVKEDIKHTTKMDSDPPLCKVHII